MNKKEHGTESSVPLSFFLCQHTHAWFIHKQFLIQIKDSDVVAAIYVEP